MALQAENKKQFADLGGIDIIIKVSLYINSSSYYSKLLTYMFFPQKYQILSTSTDSKVIAAASKTLKSVIFKSPEYRRFVLDIDGLKCFEKQLETQKDGMLFSFLQQSAIL
jgi:hypothetical protein